MVKEENQVKRLILKVFQHVIDFLLHISGLMVLFVLVSVSGCTSTKNVESAELNSIDNAKPEASTELFGKDRMYSIDKNGSGLYSKEYVDSPPLPKNGKDEWLRSLYKEIRYPASARKKGIKGEVVLEFVVDSKGQIDGLSVANGLSADIDNEAVRALKVTNQSGFTPAVFRGMAVSSKIMVPIKFNVL